MKTSESMAVPEFFYPIKVMSIYNQIQNNYSVIQKVIIRVSDSLTNSLISFRRLDISNLLSTTFSGS
jgi:hypothetical protein